MGFAEAMVLEYNGKKKNNASRLRISKLYSSESTIGGALGEDDGPYEVNDNADDFDESDREGDIADDDEE